MLIIAENNFMCVWKKNSIIVVWAKQIIKNHHTKEYFHEKSREEKVSEKNT